MACCLTARSHYQKNNIDYLQWGPVNITWGYFHKIHLPSITKITFIITYFIQTSQGHWLRTHINNLTSSMTVHPGHERWHARVHTRKRGLCAARAPWRHTVQDVRLIRLSLAHQWATGITLGDTWIKYSQLPELTHANNRLMVHSTSLYIPAHPCLYPSAPSAAHTHQWIGSALVRIMACRLFGAKTLSKLVLGYCQFDS